MQNTVLIRPMKQTDISSFPISFEKQGWHKPESQYQQYWQQQQEGTRSILVAEIDGLPVGYLTIVWEPTAGPFGGKHIPEIVDFNVLIAYQRQGIGNQLMDAAEQVISQRSDTVCIGVGLHPGYGTAQRMYVKRGYIPDGSGVWYCDRTLQPNQLCYNDDDLVLHLSKKLKK